MRAMVISSDESSTDTLTSADIPTPSPGPGEVLIDVAAAGVNRADLLQLKGMHPPPAGAPDWPGLEVSGTIAALSEGVTGHRVGDRVCALLDGGGYAEQAVARADLLLPVPDDIDLVEAASFPEALATLWSNLFAVPGLPATAGLDPRTLAGTTILVHGGSGGVGTIALQLLTGLGARVLTTAGGPDRAARCAELGAHRAIDHRSEDFVAITHAETNGNGADVVLDVVGAKYLAQNIDALARFGHLVIIGMQKGATGELNLAPVLTRWLSVHGTVLRQRPPEQKTAIIADVRKRAWPLVTQGGVRPVIHARVPLAEVSEAHQMMADGEVFGKVLLLP
ncbi:NAD(P)H-quinone oxidoreductase [Ruania alba]|uniref:Putative NAD(P)H quinone oxidoreductase, PIG3 family n=1 Tax=Ruania alba TaxID=648782 RepID=A0A1H5MHS2_9MICO|nr:NAD(P)H-quinone oxidoreductase [Ruania alba]SEE88630.1 putative NAD(P)H quinone oxidoreductase, PIG3 family [Ruania alba]